VSFVKEICPREFGRENEMLWDDFWRGDEVRATESAGLSESAEVSLPTTPTRNPVTIFLKAPLTLKRGNIVLTEADANPAV
jgi:hypothetical protein